MKSSKKMNIKNLYLGSVLKCGGIKKINLNIVRDWTFVTYIIVSKDDNDVYYNALNNDEKYKKISRKSEFGLNEKALDIITTAEVILGHNKKKFSSDDVIDAMKKSDLYFEDALDEKHNISNKKMVKRK